MNSSVKVVAVLRLARDIRRALGFRVQGAGFRVQGVGFRGVGFRV